MSKRPSFLSLGELLLNAQCPGHQSDVTSITMWVKMMPSKPPNTCKVQNHFWRRGKMVVRKEQGLGAVAEVRRLACLWGTQGSGGYSTRRMLFSLIFFGTSLPLFSYSRNQPLNRTLRNTILISFCRKKGQLILLNLFWKGEEHGGKDRTEAHCCSLKWHLGVM